jgi:hypothetical protein
MGVRRIMGLAKAGLFATVAAQARQQLAEIVIACALLGSMGFVM